MKEPLMSVSGIKKHYEILGGEEEFPDIFVLIATVDHWKEERNKLSRKLNQNPMRTEFLHQEEVKKLKESSRNDGEEIDAAYSQIDDLKKEAECLRQVIIAGDAKIKEMMEDNTKLKSAVSRWTGYWQRNYKAVQVKREENTLLIEQNRVANRDCNAFRLQLDAALKRIEEME